MIRKAPHCDHFLLVWTATVANFGSIKVRLDEDLIKLPDLNRIRIKANLARL